MAGATVRYVEERDRKRISSSAAWSPSDGDICLPYKLSGDCFYRYRAFRDVHGTGVFEEVGEFGAYVFGDPVNVRIQLTLDAPVPAEAQYPERI